MRESWTDERLDDLSGRVEDLGRRMESRFSHVESEIQGLRSESTSRLDGMQRTMVHMAVGMTSAMIVGFIGLAGLILSQG